MLARVAVFAPLDTPLDYLVPDGLRRRIMAGSRVWVPLGHRPVEGVVLELLSAPQDVVALRAIERLVDAPPVAPALLELGRWIAEYYMAPAGEVMRLFLPVGGAAKVRKRWALKPAGDALAKSLASPLIGADAAALAPVDQAVLTRLALGVLDEKTYGTLPPAQQRALVSLVQRNLVAAEVEPITKRRRTVAWLSVGRPATADEVKRAPKRAAILAAVAAAGALPLSAFAEQRALVALMCKAGLLVRDEREEAVDFDAPVVLDTNWPELNAEQQVAVAAITKSIDAGEPQPFLLHGITGSGKTEVYLALIRHVLSLGKTALVLVPEIALTPQLGGRFRARFGDRVAVLHSGMTATARQRAWHRIERGEAPIALGARSAVFAPLDKLGIVVVDEEHDSSFKQEDGVRYHGRDVALVRARQAGAVTVLGSATPSLEIFHAAARDERMRLLEMTQRATPRPLPTVEIVDLKQHVLGDRNLFSAPLREAIRASLERGEQAIVFLNRRGFATCILCRSCGEEARCRNCSVTLTFHRGANELRCHYCDFRAPVSPRCDRCGGGPIIQLGYGTEQVEAQLAELFPTARIGRLDRDTADEEGLTHILERVRNRELDLLVGTQMLTKGHDFPGVTIVGVVLADGGMGLPDFRATERTFQLLVQVAGRAGRGEQPGRVVIQTYNPDHPAVLAAQRHDYQAFAEGELVAREELHYPPFGRLVCVRFDGPDAAAVAASAHRAADAVRAACERAPSDVLAQLVGPSEAPLQRLKGRVRWQLFIKAAHPRALRSLARAALSAELGTNIRRSVDVDPVAML